MVLRERAANRAMLDDVDEAIDSIAAHVARKQERARRHETMLAIVAAALLLQRKLAGTIASHRQEARLASADRLTRELQVAGIDVDHHMLRGAALSHALDVAHAEAAASSLSSAWQSAAVASVGRDAEQTAAIRRIDRTRTVIRSRVDRTAATEIASAYNDEHVAALARVSDAYDDVASAIQAAGLVLVWDAVLDRRTCDHCDQRHGSIIEPGEEPPGHPMCRCIAILDVAVAARAAA
jgi:hypothetical protein